MILFSFLLHIEAAANQILPQPTRGAQRSPRASISGLHYLKKPSTQLVGFVIDTWIPTGIWWLIMRPNLLTALHRGEMELNPPLVLYVALSC